MSLSVKELRASFLGYFEGQGHVAMPSSALVPHNDPTLMFTNAGMVQFKDIFTGKQARPAPAATTSQKCVRAGGKHNDLDNVGYTARHHTFFEMLGNFSFGDYFKEQAIEHAWNLLTKEWGLDKSKLSFTVYHDDDEAFDLWKKISGCSDDKILRIATSDNFWSMGDVGPCGPCSEIFYDHGESAAKGAWALDANGSDLFGDRFIEIWNLVFMQYEQSEAGRENLPKPSIDTGMGLERIAAVMQGVHDNYDIDLFQNLINATQEILPDRPYTNSIDETLSRTYDDVMGVPGKLKAPIKASHKVVADHLRSSGFLIADGVMPSNEGRGYVLRRIMRRAMRHMHQLGAEEPLMYKLVPALIGEMGAAFPELGRAEALITETLRAEETRFQTTLVRGLKLLENETDKLADGEALSGEVAFKLYDTYGFPVDLTADILRGQNRALDEAGFGAAMNEQKARARAAWSGSGEAATDAAWFDLLEAHGPTEFLGYSQCDAQGCIVAMVNDAGDVVSEAKAGDKLRVLFNQTPFYGESGGQMGDAGHVQGEGFSLQIDHCTKPLGELIVHHAIVVDGVVKTGDAAELCVDVERQNRLKANHSATHILHKALRDQLGEHVTQKGSLVAPDRLRFDFSHGQAVTADELRAVEAQVNAVVWQNNDVATAVQTPEAAMEAGAMALFGEKYGDEVRVVSMGHAATKTMDEQASAYSVELCGGTHVARTGDIGLFAIVGESSVAAGIRRIEAVTGAEALKHMHAQQAQLVGSAQALKCAPAELPERLSALQDERKQLQQQLAEAKKQLAMGGGDAQADAPEDVNGVKFLAKHFDDMSPKELKPLADQFKQQIGSGVVLLVSGAGGKASIVAGVTADLVERINAVDLVRAGAEAAGGKGGGGRPDMAQAGGPNADAGAIAGAVKALVA